MYYLTSLEVFFSFNLLLSLVAVLFVRFLDNKQCVHLAKYQNTETM